MFDIGLLELLLLSIVVLLVVGPRRLPETLRTLGLWLGRMRRSFTRVKSEIEREIGMDDVRRQLHNEAVMEQMKEIERDIGGAVDEARIDPAREEPPQDTLDAEEPAGGQAVEPSGPQAPTGRTDESSRKAGDG